MWPPLHPSSPCHLLLLCRGCHHAVLLLLLHTPLKASCMGVFQGCNHRHWQQQEQQQQQELVLVQSALVAAAAVGQQQQQQQHQQ